MILSTTKVEDVATSELLSFSLPPPLNYYIYPQNIVILSGSEKKPDSLTCELLVKHCTKFKATMQMEANLNVYDVPLAETTYEDNEEDSEEEEEEIYNESENEEEAGEEDWEEDDEDIPVA